MSRDRRSLTSSPVRSGSPEDSRRRGRSPERRSDSPKRKRDGSGERRKDVGIRVRPDIKHVFVGPTGQRMGNNIKYYISEKELEDRFSEYGEVENVKVRSNTKDVFAFVHFKDSESAARAIEGMNGKQLEGVKVKVDWGSNNAARAPRKVPPFARRGRSRSPYDRYRRRSPPRERYYERRRSPSPRYRRRSPPRRSPSPRYKRHSPSPRYSRRSPSPRYSRRSPSPYRR